MQKQKRAIAACALVPTQELYFSVLPCIARVAVVCSVEGSRARWCLQPIVAGLWRSSPRPKCVAAHAPREESMPCLVARESE
eukprot:2347100-Prymnesium_polylepis.3